MWGSQALFRASFSCRFGCSLKLDEGVYLDGLGADFRDQRCLVWSRGEAVEVIDGLSGTSKGGCGVSSESLEALAQRWQALVPPEERRERQSAYLEAKPHGNTSRS